jgi:hypothetical protein
MSQACPELRSFASAGVAVLDAAAVADGAVVAGPARVAA